MPTNDFIGFASSGSANVMSQADFAAAHEQLVGVQPGPATSALANKIWRQGSNMAAALGDMMSAQGYDALDDGDISKLAKNLLMALAVAVDYTTTYDFKSGSVCRYNGDLYIALIDNGPNTSVKNPTDTTAWRSYLPLTGGTMTGSLKAKMAGVRGTAPASKIEQYFPDYIDANDTRYGLLQAQYNTDMSSEIAMFAYDTTQASGMNIGRLGLGCDSGGGVYTVAPTPPTSDSSTKIATTAYVQNNISDVERVVNYLGNYYIRYSSGLQICMSYLSVSATGSQVTYLLPFITDPIVLITPAPGSNTTDTYIFVTDVRSGTGCTIYANKNGSHFSAQCYYMAIGQWR